MNKPDQNQLDSSLCAQFPLLDHIESGILAIDRNGKIVLWNNKMEQWRELPREEVLGKKLFDLFPETAVDVFKSRIGQVLAGGAPVIFSTQKHHHLIACVLPHGKFRAQQVTVTWLQDHRIALFTVLDQTEQVRLIEQYKASARSLKSELEQRQVLEKKNMQLAAAIDQAGEAVIIADVAGRIEYANQSFVDQTGWQSDETHSVDYFDVLIDSSDGNFSEQLKYAVEAEEAWIGRQQVLRKSGSSFIASISIAPITNDDGDLTHYIIIQEDIAWQMELEEKMRHTQKQEALITLIGGIAHDFNNLLAGLIGQVYLASREVVDMPKTAERLKKIQASAQDAAEIVKQLLTFARQGEHYAKEFSLSSFMNEFVKLARLNVPENIKLTSDFERGAVNFRGDINQLQLSLLNIVQNAVEACNHVEEPHLEIILKPFNSTEYGYLLKKYPVLRHGHFAHVLIRDNGIGMPANMLERIFDPFFTTKQLGSGLGLAMVMGCVRHHQGIIDVESEPDHGSSFHLFLPTLIPQTPVSIEEKKQFGSGVNILLVDDDERVLEATKELLECMQHNVTTACDGREACEVFEQQSADWDILITDIVMPHMDGVAASKEMRLVRPDLPVIYATGYDQSLVTKEARNMQNTILISKPFNPDDLDRLISSLVK